MADSASNAAPLLSLTGVHKRFGGVHALRGASLEVSRPGVVHALIGQNGSGKSTLLGVLSGQLRPDAGTLRLEGSPVSFPAPAAAIAHGIAMVSQETAVVPDLTVAENVLLGRRLARTRFGLDPRRTREQAVAVLERVGLDYDPERPVRRLRSDQRQMIEICRALAMDARILILDEPTSALTDDEVESLFTAVNQLRRQGVSIVYVSHRLSELFTLADEVTVVRDGQTVAVGAMSEFSTERLVTAMVGETAQARARPQHRARGVRADALAVTGLTVEGILHGVDLTVGAGEIVGVAGLVGAGRSELLQAIFGLIPAAGVIEVNGRPLSVRTPRDAIAQGLGYLPADRKNEGVILRMSVLDNLGLVRTNRRPRLARPRDSHERMAYDEACRTMRIRTASPDAAVGTLSGGNQQKVALGKWLGTDTTVLLLDEPTRGVDVAAKAEIHERLRATARTGTGLLVSSSEDDELLELCDRIVVLFRGRVMANLDSAQATERELARLAGGQA